jgi:UDP-N-acetylglucosamine 2-epimerase (non-hydrolysing)/GDP/UDP-N,N'-diacetylbacillosamine 2-epimerase (hydrolysing)
MKKIAVVTGTRAEYGILKSVLDAIRAKAGLELQLVVTGMHLSHEFGYTVDEIEKDGYKIAARVEMIPENDTPEAVSSSIGRGVTGMAQAWQRLKPDIIVVLGDRTEPLAATIAGAYMNIPIAHIHGGDSSLGGLDEYARHAITKMSHIHFPATQKSAERIIKMGEDPWRVHVVGSPALDAILHKPLIAPEAIAGKYNINLNKPLVLLIQHAVSTQPEQAGGQIKETLDAVVETGHQTIIIYPNSDAGGRSIITTIEAYTKKYHQLKAYPSLPRRDYLSLLKIAGVMVGNSSSGIIDAPSFGLPAVNIGLRQEGRERGDNVIDVEHRKEAIVKAINKALTDRKFIQKVKKGVNPYGDGRAGERIAGILSNVEKTPELLQKKITFQV